MSLNVETANKLWDDFLARWPLSSLESLSLEEYTKAGANDSFIYWLESKTEDLGSIWGGSAFKFGIYHRDNNEQKENKRGRVYETEYAWYAKYGKSPAEAFANVRAEVVKIATAAKAGNLSAIEAADLGPAVKWKIAFLYQDRDHPRILPIYKLEMLRRIVDASGKLGFSEIYAELFSKIDGKPLFQFAVELWEKGKELLTQELTHADALAYLQERFKPVKEPVRYLAGFETEEGKQLGLNRQGSNVTAFIEPGDWPMRAPGVVHRRRYSKDEPRLSSLQANAPSLYVGHPADYLNIPTMAALVALCDSYDASNDEPNIDHAHSKQANQPAMESRPCMNTILYGPPGTGKTYKTAELAVQICDGSGKRPRAELMARYEHLRQEGRINFVTFHQSYGYEDFVEGLRPEIKDGQVTYRVRPGIFREVCDAARRSTLVKPGLTGKPLKERTIHKMSLGIAGTVEGKLAFQECIEKGYVLLGWGNDVDFSECKDAEEIRKKVDADGNFEKPDSQARYVSVFKEEVQVGDIIIVSQGNRAFRAIAEVTGEYEYLEAASAGKYHQMRPVRWLAVFEGNRNVDEIYDRNFVQSSLYRLDPAGLNFGAIDGLIKGQQGSSEQSFVLIIDEINRANISKVFGELITLLEPDKREGAINAVTVKLPYSADEFSVPPNLHVIGTMNTADRSIALLDTALRRRFEFQELQPDPSLLQKESVGGVDLQAMLKALNERIEYLYDRDHTIGHSYFMNVVSLTDLDAAFRHKVIPLLQEYFYENWAKVLQVLNDSSGGFITASTEVPKGLDALDDGLEPRPRYRMRDDTFPLDAYLTIYQ